MKNMTEIDSDDNLNIDLCADPIVDEKNRCVCCNE